MEDSCRTWREQLGAYALGLTAADEATALRAHLAACERCSHELMQLAPAAAALHDVDVTAVSKGAEPPPGLRAQIFARLERERQAERRVHIARRLTAAAAVIALLAIGSLLRPSPASPPTEEVAVAIRVDGVTAEAALINHTWGTEVVLEAAGLDDGEAYVLQFTTTQGERVPGGTFLGVGEESMVCRMNAALLRDDASGFAITDSNGTAVIEGRLEPREAAGGGI
jgi:hypothetical protein